MADGMRVLVVGSGKNFQHCVGVLREREVKGEINIVAVTDDNVYASRVFDWPFWKWDDLAGLVVQCAVIATDGDNKAILSKIHERGIGDDYIIPWEALFLPGFSFLRYLQLKRSHVSIIANMCWGGVTYHYFHLPFYSPFINMFVWKNEYLEMLRHLKETLASPLKYERDDYEKNMKRNFPVFSTGGVQLFMNHYTDREFARKKWEERKQRINWDNLFIMMYTEDPKEAKQFDLLPYKKKVCFTNFQSDLPSVCFLELSQHPMFKGRQAFYFISGIAHGCYMFYDPWKLLMNGDHTSRWSFGQHS